MAKKQTRRSISVSRTTYERLKAFCETNNISMSQLVETRVNDFLGAGDVPVTPSSFSPAPVIPSYASPAAMPSHTAPSSNGFSSAPFRPAPRPMPAPQPIAKPIEARPVVAAPAPVAPAPVAPPVVAAVATPAPAPMPAPAPAPVAPAAPVPMTSAAARFAVEPPPPIIKPRQDTNAPKPAEKRPDQIFTF